MNLTFNAERHEYKIDGVIVPSVTQILSAVGLYDYDFVSRETLDVAAERGRIVHQYCEWYERGVLDQSSIDPELQGYFDAYLSAKNHGVIPAPDLVEHRVGSKKFNYAGTLDQFFEPGWINDIKTGAKSPEHGLQVSGYWMAMTGDMTSKPGRLTCLYLARDGSHELVKYRYEPLPWIAIVADYQWRAKNNKIKPRWR